MKPTRFNLLGKTAFIIFYFAIILPIQGAVPVEIQYDDYGDYSNHTYFELKAEYDEQLRIMATTSTTPRAISTKPPTTTEQPKESYEEAATRLSCDNPWFWNTFKCVYLDVKNKNVQPRTRSNLKIASFIAGPPIILVLLSCCLCTCYVCFILYRRKKVEQMIEEYLIRYQPGVIQLSNGEFKGYRPTKEEMDAFHNLLQILSSVV